MSPCPFPPSLFSPRLRPFIYLFKSVVAPFNLPPYPPSFLHLCCCCQPGVVTELVRTEGIMHTCASLLFPDCFQATIRTTDNFPFVLADRVLFLGSICSRNIRIWGRQICDHSSLARCVGHSPFTFCLICCCVSDDNVRCFSQCLYYISALSTKGILKKVKRNSK